MKQKAGALGLGAGLLAAAALLAVLALGFLFATVAAALATFLPTWLALLLTTALLVLLGAILGLVGRASVRKGTPPLPQQAITEAKRTTEAIKEPTR